MWQERIRILYSQYKQLQGETEKFRSRIKHWEVGAEEKPVYNNDKENIRHLLEEKRNLKISYSQKVEIINDLENKIKEKRANYENESLEQALFMDDELLKLHEKTHHKRMRLTLKELLDVSLIRSGSADSEKKSGESDRSGNHLNELLVEVALNYVAESKEIESGHTTRKEKFEQILNKGMSDIEEEYSLSCEDIDIKHVQAELDLKTIGQKINIIDDKLNKIYISNNDSECKQIEQEFYSILDCTLADKMEEIRTLSFSETQIRLCGHLDETKSQVSSSASEVTTNTEQVNLAGKIQLFEKRITKSNYADIISNNIEKKMVLQYTIKKLQTIKLHLDNGASISSISESEIENLLSLPSYNHSSTQIANHSQLAGNDRQTDDVKQSGILIARNSIRKSEDYVALYQYPDINDLDYWQLSGQITNVVTKVSELKAKLALFEKRWHTFTKTHDSAQLERCAIEDDLRPYIKKNKYRPEKKHTYHPEHDDLLEQWHNELEVIEDSSRNLYVTGKKIEEKQQRIEQLQELLPRLQELAFIQFRTQLRLDIEECALVEGRVNSNEYYKDQFVSKSKQLLALVSASLFNTHYDDSLKEIIINCIWSYFSVIIKLQLDGAINEQWEKTIIYLLNMVKSFLIKIKNSDQQQLVNVDEVYNFIDDIEHKDEDILKNMIIIRIVRFVSSIGAGISIFEARLHLSNYIIFRSAMSESDDNKANSCFSQLYTNLLKLNRRYKRSEEEYIELYNTLQQSNNDEIKSYDCRVDLSVGLVDDRQSNNTDEISSDDYALSSDGNDSEVGYRSNSSDDDTLLESIQQS